MIGLLFPVMMLLMFGYLFGGGMTCQAAAGEWWPAGPPGTDPGDG